MQRHMPRKASHLLLAVSCQARSHHGQTNAIMVKQMPSWSNKCEGQERKLTSGSEQRKIRASRKEQAKKESESNGTRATLLLDPERLVCHVHLLRLILIVSKRSSVVVPRVGTPDLPTRLYVRLTHLSIL
jgi:hypothetical protein